MPRNAALATKPEMFRTAKASGSKAIVDREGGKFGAGVISGVSVITAGEALGHYAWIDDVFIDQVYSALKSFSDGVKSRWTHPDMSSDGLGKLTSRIMDPEKSKNGKQVYADQHFLQIGHRSPDGDLAAYLMDLAEEDPSAYGLSIVFYRDWEAMDEFRLANTTDGVFTSPDPENVNHYEHIRLKSLEAADAVDEPAANPAGLFSRNKDIAREADAIASFALGLNEERPEVVSLGLDPDRVRGFASRFLLTHGLELTRKDMKLGAKKDAKLSDSQTTEPAEKPAEGGEGTKPAETTPASDGKPADGGEGDGKPAEEPEGQASRAEAAKFKTLFGDQGAIWYAEGLSLDEAQQRHNSSLEDRLSKVEQQLKADGKVDGEGKAAGFAADDNKQGRKGFEGKFRFK